MAEYELTEEADSDLLGIARYTIKTWGMAQALRYEVALEGHFAAIGRGDTHARTFWGNRPDLMFSRCEHHYIFFLLRVDAVPLIIAVFHERMDLMSRLRERLEK